jgi:5-hydroxyisourate hydrolase
MRIVRMPPVRYARSMAGTLSTHVLDTGTGRPASGVTVELHRGDRLIASATTDGDGRIRELARDLAPGTYRLTFEVRSPFFSRVALDVEIGEGHHHVPLVVSPFGVASYRGG